jgi:hypothetical protein
MDLVINNEIVDVCERCPQNREGGCGHYGDCHTGGLMSRIDQKALDGLVDKIFPKETIVSTEEPITTAVLVTGINNVDKIVNLAEKNNKSSIDYIPEEGNEPALDYMLEILKLMCRSEFDNAQLMAMIDAANEPPGFLSQNNRASRRSKGVAQRETKWKRDSKRNKRWYY